jgi:hypothetical protein
MKIVAVSDKVFTAVESSTDYHVTLVEHFAINVHNETAFMLRVTNDLVKFDIRVCSNGTETLKNGRICLSIQVSTSQQDSLPGPLYASFSVKNRHDSWIALDQILPTLLVNNAQIHHLILLNNVGNETNEVLVDRDILTIGINGSCTVHSQHTIATPTVKFNPELHTSVNASYTWTVCNLTLSYSNVAYTSVESGTFFTNLGVAEFYLFVGLELQKKKDRKSVPRRCVTIYSFLENTPISIKLPFRAQETFELIDSNSPKHAVIASKSSSDLYIRATMTSSESVFEYTDVVNSMNQQQCATFKFYVAYAAVNTSRVTP